ncbi:MAG: tRNA pseudouridine13 synthase [Thermoplasmata archaeon]|jgi:tRNA pseudouridine13 synthase|nr:tRNA pseudouridine13 synthase [Thermoplasmata archaeon]
MSLPVPPAEERALGLASYLTPQPGIGGKLRVEPEDFQVIELGDGPTPFEQGAHAAARVRLRNWETNRFVGEAARRLGLHREQVAFAGMKDKRAVTEQWFTFKCPVAELAKLDALSDVQVLESYPTRKAHFAGAHEGNRFVLRVRQATADAATVEGIVATIRAQGGVPHFFGPQRFGGAYRAVTHLVGEAIVAGDLEEAVRLYAGHPMAGEREEAFAARKVYEETRDPAAALAVYPRQLDPERAILERLVRKPGDWRYAIQALPGNLLQLFVHARQSWLFNHIVSARVAAGLGLNTAHPGDRVMGMDEDGVATHLVTERSRPRVQKELDLGRATLTAPLVGMTVPLAEGVPGEIEQEVLDAHGVHPFDFRVRELPEVASEGRRRGILQPVRDLQVEWREGDPVFSFALGKGSYATVVLREFMKAPLTDY